MKSFLFALRGGICLLALLMPVVAHGQDRPIALDNELRSARTLSDQDLATIARYVQYYLKRLTPPEDAGDRYLQIHTAKKQLTSDVFSAGVSTQFRQAYSDAAIPTLKTILKGTDERAAVDAIRIAAEICTGQALDLVVDEFESKSSLRRVTSAGRAKIPVRAAHDSGTKKTTIQARSIATLARKTEEAAIAETNVYALQNQLELLDALHTATLVSVKLAASKTRIQDSRLKVLGRRVAKLKSPEIEAIHGFLISLKSTFMVDNARAISDGKQLANHIDGILAHCLSQWDEAHNDKDTNAAYTQLLNECQQFLNLIDVKLRSSIANRPKTNLSGSWEQKDKAKFESELKVWKELHSKSPYGG